MRDVAHRSDDRVRSLIATSPVESPRPPSCSGSSATPPDSSSSSMPNVRSAPATSAATAAAATGGWPRAWRMRALEHAGRGVRRHRHLVRAAGPGRRASARGPRRRSGSRPCRRRRGRGSAARPRGRRRRTTPPPRRGSAARRAPWRRRRGARGAARPARGRDRRRRSATVASAPSSGRGTAPAPVARLRTNRASPARWLSATTIVGSRPGNDSRSAMPRASSHAGSAPIQNGSGAPATASAAADSSSRSTSRSLWRTSQRAIAWAWPTAQVVGADADHRDLGPRGPARRRRAPTCCAAARWRGDRSRRAAT